MPYSTSTKKPLSQYTVITPKRVLRVQARSKGQIIKAADGLIKILSIYQDGEPIRDLYVFNNTITKS